MATVPELIQQWKEKRIDGLALMRALISYDKWSILISEKAAVEAMAHNDMPTVRIIAQPNGEKWLTLFSSNEAYALYAKGNNIEEKQHMLTTRGTWVFAMETDQLDRLWIDPFNEHDIFYDKEVFGRLRDMAHAVLVEEALIGLRQGNGPEDAIPRARDYKNYYVAVASNSEHKPYIVMAPDNQGRTLAAAFTADDTFDAFLPEAKQLAGSDEVTQVQFDGKALFDMFLRMQIDGFVFNCAGPIKPVAFAKPAAEVILTGK